MNLGNTISQIVAHYFVQHICIHIHPLRIFLTNATWCLQPEEGYYGKQQILNTSMYSKERIKMLCSPDFMLGMYLYVVE